MQYSVTEHFKSVEFGSSQSIPGVFFYYDLSPVKVGNISTFKVYLKRKTILFFIVILELQLSSVGDDNLILFAQFTLFLDYRKCLKAFNASNDYLKV